MKTGPKPKALLDRLADKFVIAESGCWLWTASKGTSGYGQIGFNGRPIGSHRAAYMAWVGSIPAGLEVCHRCDVKICINPSHLFLGTQRDNVLDMTSKGRGYMKPGESHPGAKLTWRQICAIREDDRRQQAIAFDHGVSRSLIGMIKSNRIWTDAKRYGGT